MGEGGELGVFSQDKLRAARVIYLEAQSAKIPTFTRPNGADYMLIVTQCHPGIAIAISGIHLYSFRILSMKSRFGEEVIVIATFQVFQNLETLCCFTLLSL